jgi:hypothetical protein
MPSPITPPAEARAADFMKSLRLIILIPFIVCLLLDPGCQFG